MSTPPERSFRVDQALRPLRLGFLVDVNSRRSVSWAIAANTCRWGGIFNFLIPAFRRRPRDWPDGLSGPEIVRGYLAAFEPDYVITDDAAFADRVGLEPHMLVSPTELNRFTDRGDIGYGVPTLGLLEWMYEHELRFVPRVPFRVINVERQSSRGLFAEALFGAFSHDDKGEIVSSVYRQLREFVGVTGTGDSLTDYLTPGSISPIGITAVGCGDDREHDRGVRLLFVMDPRFPGDVVDFWNLRAFGLRPIPIPADDVDAAIDAHLTRAQAENEFERLAYGRVFRVLKSRNVLGATAEQVARSAGTEGPLTSVPLLPLWDSTVLRDLGVRRRRLTTSATTRYAASSDRSVEFDLLKPDYRTPYAATSPRFANVVSLQHQDWTSDAASVIPPDSGRLSELFGVLHGTVITSTSEGLVVLDQWGGRQYWRVPDSLAVFRRWIQRRGVQGLELSEPGVIAREISVQLQTIQRTAWIVHPSLLKLINSSTRADEDSHRSIGRHQMLQTLGKLRASPMLRGQSATAVDHLRALLNLGVFAVGTTLKCFSCGYTNWFDIQSLNVEVTCQRCGKSIRFPAESPPTDRHWSYRPTGPFAAPDYARGAYAVLMAIRFFEDWFHRGITWLPSAKGSMSRTKEFEVDFAVWGQEQRFGGGSRLVFGECKTFGPFQDKDLARARDLLRMFPESVMTFATLRTTLNQTERKKIRALARVRRRGGAGAERSRIIVLTANELLDFSAAGVSFAWKEAGGEFLGIADTYEQAAFDLGALSQATLDLYVGLSGPD